MTIGRLNCTHSYVMPLCTEVKVSKNELGANRDVTTPLQDKVQS